MQVFGVQGAWDAIPAGQFRQIASEIPEMSRPGLAHCVTQSAESWKLLAVSLYSKALRAIRDSEAQPFIFGCRGEAVGDHDLAVREIGGTKDLVALPP